MSINGIGNFAVPYIPPMLGNMKASWTSVKYHIFMGLRKCTHSILSTGWVLAAHAQGREDPGGSWRTSDSQSDLVTVFWAIWESMGLLPSA